MLTLLVSSWNPSFLMVAAVVFSNKILNQLRKWLLRQTLSTRVSIDSSLWCKMAAALEMVTRTAWMKMIIEKNILTYGIALMEWDSIGLQIWSRVTLQWSHNEHDGVSNHPHFDCFLNILFDRRSKKTLKLRFTGFCEGNPQVTGEFPAQRASNAENVSIWRRHHAMLDLY